MTYHSTRPAKALTNALERLMISISAQELEVNFALLTEYRAACELLGYDPAMAQWCRVKHINVVYQHSDEDQTLCYFPKLNPEE